MNDVEISKKICEYRKRKGLTIKELANLTGVTSSLLSQIEKGTANPSLNTIKQISNALNIPLFNFFINDSHTENLVVRKNKRKKMVFKDDENLAYELLTPNLQGDIEFVLMTIPPNEYSSNEQFSHKGEEVAYVISGNVNLYMLNTVIELNCGDSVKIPTLTQHKWENISNKECQVIFAVTPPSF